MRTADIKQTIEDIDDGPICLRPAPGTCCPDNTRHIMCVGCGKDYGSYCEAIDLIKKQAYEEGFQDGAEAAANDIAANPERL